MTEFPDSPSEFYQRWFIHIPDDKLEKFRDEIGRVATHHYEAGKASMEELGANTNLRTRMDKVRALVENLETQFDNPPARHATIVGIREALDG